MQTIEIRSGKHNVIASRNDEGSKWSARLYVNETTATLTAARFKTEAGVRRWAAKVLEA